MKISSVLLAANSTYGARSEFENFFEFLRREPQIETVAIAHPLLRRQGIQSTKILSSRRGEISVSTVERHLRPPLSFLADKSQLRSKSSYDVVIGFNPLQTLIHRSVLKPKGVVVNWAIDFVPSRYYPWPIRHAYGALDRKMVRCTDLLIENNESARSARVARAGRPASKTIIVPITVADSWFENDVQRNPTTPNVIYVGAMNKRNNIEFIANLAARVLESESEIRFTFIGAGPLSEYLVNYLTDRGFGNRFTYCGFIEDEQEVFRHLQNSTIALAPYRHDDDSFTRFADPQKLKWYAAAGVPIMMSPEPPNSRELEKSGSSLVLSAETNEDVHIWSSNLLELVRDGRRLEQMRMSARKWAGASRRSEQYERVLEEIQFIWHQKHKGK